MISNDDVVVELERIISRREYVLSVEDSDKFHLEYDALCKTEPLSWKITKFKTFFEYSFEWAKDIEEYIKLAKENVEYLKKQWILNPYWDIMWRRVVVNWYERISFDNYLNKKVSEIKNLRGKDINNNPSLYLSKTLGINPSQIRNIYIKLLLEGKINIWDLKDLCISKNSDINLYNIVNRWAGIEQR